MKFRRQGKELLLVKVGRGGRSRTLKPSGTRRCAGVPPVEVWGVAVKN